MENKNSMSRVERLHREKVTRYSIRKYSFGAASVAVAALFMFLGNGAVSADMTTVQPQDESSLKAKPTDGNTELPHVDKEVAQPAESTSVAQPIAEESTAKPAEPATPALDKTQLESYIAEIEAKIANGSYANKTDESVAVLKADLEAAKTTLVNATSQDELTKAYNKLVTTANTKLKNKPVEKKETPAVDTTNGKETVGKKAENTEKKSDSNSIENTGSKDPRNGKVMDKDNALRTETSKTVDNITYTTEFSNDATKEIYVYNKEEANVEFKIVSSTNKVTYVETTGGSNQKFTAVNDTTVTDGYGYNFNKITTETDTPLTVKMTGQPNDFIMSKPAYNKTEAQNFAMGERYLRVTAKDGSSMSPAANGVTQPGYFKIVLKSQTYKYSIQEPALDGDKIGVDDIDNLTATDITNIKNRINIEYSKTSTDARLESVKGTALEDKNTVVENIDVNPTTKVITVTYKDGSTDTATLSSVVRNNVAPTVSIPYSDPAPNKKEVYLYTGEEADVDITFNDDSGKIKSAALRKGGNIALNNVGGNPDVQDNEWGFNVTAINSETATPAKIKITGQVSGIAPDRLPKTEDDSLELVTRFATATDKDGKEINNIAVKNKNNGEVVGSYLTDPGAVTFVLKAQAKKYDMVKPSEEDKVAVANPEAVTDEEFARIKAKLEYSRTNEDKNLESKRGEEVDNTDNKIATITKEGNNIVATYKDGSKDVRPLSDFTKLDKQPAIDAVKKAAEDKIAAINSTPNATDEEKAAAVAKVNADKEKALTAINDATAKDALDQAQNNGTTAISADNPVVAKKDAAKADVEAARKAKEDAIKADTNLTQAEKDAAIAKNNTAAAEATKAIDAATTNDAVDQAKTAGTTAIGKVNPVAKENAKEAIANALTDKNSEIDKRTDLTNAEKTAAKAEAQKLADAELAKINAQPDNAETADAAAAAQKIVDGAEDKGVGDVTSVNPVAKEAAKKAVADELTKKEEQIDARTDLTTEEKAAAKKEAQAKAKESTDAIDAQPSITDSADKATAAQKAVDVAKDKGVADVKAVNPEAAKKTEAKQAIDDALTAKNNEIDARTDLTPEEKTKAKEIAKAKADAAKVAVDKATTNAEVDKAKTDGTTAVANVTPVAKEAAKKAVADELAKKEAEIDARTDLTQEEKDAAKKDAQDKAKSATDAINAQPDNADTPEKAAEAQKAVDTAKKTGVDEVAAVNPEAVTKPAAKKAIDDKLAEQLKAIENTPDATDEEKKVAADAAKALAEEAKKAIDKAGTDAEVKQLQDEAKKEIEKSVPVVEDKPNARKAIDDEATAKKAAIDARDDLTPKAKEDLKAQVDKIAEQAKKSVDAAKTAEAVNGIEESDKAAIKAVGEVNIPADKVLVNDPSALTDAEKAKVLEAVKKVNPDAKEITQDADGNITVTTPDGHQEIITPEQVVKTADTANDPKAGNDVVKPADKVVVNDPAKLTDAEKEKIKAAVEAVNPNSVVTVDEKGNAKVSTPDGQTQVIPVEELVRTVEDTKKPNAGNDIVKPADKTVVANPDALTPEEKKAIEDKVKAVNPGATVVVDDKGNATVTTPAGKTAVIPASDLTKSEADAAKPNAGNDIVKPADKTVVANPDKLTDAEKKAIEDKVKAVNPGSTVVVDDNGNATVTTPAGKTAVIPASDLTKSAADAAKPNAGNDVNTPAAKIVVANPDKLTDAEKKAIEDKVKAVNPGAIVVVDDKGNATVTTPEGKTAVIPATDLVKTQDDITKENAGNDVNTPAAKTVVANPDKLTDAEKKAIEDKVKAVNPGSTVVVDDKGNATVAKGDGTVLNIPALDLVIPADDLVDAAKNTAVKTPAIRTLVADKEKLTDAEKAAVKKAIEAVNPGATVVVDDKGNATVTLDGNTVSIAKDQLVKTASDVTAKNSGDNINLDFEKETVADLNNLTDAEKEAAKAKIKGANADVVEVIFDKAGNATVVTKDGKVLAIAAEDIFKQRPSDPNNGGNGTSGNNGTTSTDVKVDKAKLEGAIRQLDELIIKESAKLDAETAKEANDLLADAKKVFANADASQAEVDAMVKRIEDFIAKVAPSTDHATPTNDQAAQTPAVAPATTQAANASQTASAQANTRTVAKELPNTGTADSVVSMVAAATSALLGLGLAGRRRKEDEEA